MHADSVFVIGDSHRVCQDYALHSANSKTIYAVLSDGCSGSADTDVGARLMALQTADFVRQFGAPKDAEDGRIIVSQANTCARLLGLPDTVLDATVLSLTYQEGLLNVFCVGDGVVSALYRPKELEVWDIEIPSGYPLYLSYLLRASRYVSVLKKGEIWTVYRESLQLDAELPISRREKYCDYAKVDAFTYCYGVESIDPFVVAVFSDGIKSFRDAEGQDIPVNQVVRELMDFKGYKGEFVKRRMQGFLRDARKRGWTHDDDLSMAAIYLESEEI